MYESYLGLSERPFSLVPDPRYFFASHAHKEAMDYLLYGISAGEGFIVVTGEVGTGKTTLCRTLLKHLEPNVETAVILNPCQSAEELLGAVLEDLGVPIPLPPSRKTLLDALNRYLLESRAKGKRVVLIIDEAQNLPPRVLEQIRIISNLETEKEKLIQVILIGQVELSERLARHDLRQLNQRLSVRYRLCPLRPKETRAYILFRLHRAGCQRDDFFTRTAFRRIHRLSRGYPRLINLICDRALLALSAKKSKRVGLSLVREAWRSLYPEWDPASRRRWGVSWASRLGYALGVLVIGLAMGMVFG
jgi:general secretion pathway protein A